MKNLNPNPENCRRNGVIGLGLMPDHGPTTINIKVSHGLNQYEVAVPSNSSFGYLKFVISERIGLKPEMHKLLFRGEEKEDNEHLQTAGVKENSEVLLREDTSYEQKSREEIQENCVTSKGDEAVAEVRKEVDKLAQQVSALEAVVDNGTKVDDKEIVYLTEMLMRQLLKLDGVEAQGEAKVQRKMEVRRVQSIVETLDILKSRNSRPFSNTTKTVSVTNGQWEAFNPDSGSVRSITTQWETFDPHSGSSNASFPMPPSAPSPMPHYVPSVQPYCVPSPPTPYFIHTPCPGPYYVPSSLPPSPPFPMPSSTKVTQNWEHFG